MSIKKLIIYLVFLAIITSVVYRASNPGWIAYAKAENFYKNEQHDKAIEFFLIAMEKRVKINYLIGDLSKSLLKSYKYQNSNSLFEELLKKDPKNFQVFKKLGDFFFAIENYNQAIQIYNYVLSIKNDPVTRYELALSLSRNGQYENAASEYKKLLGEK